MYEGQPGAGEDIDGQLEQDVLVTASWDKFLTSGIIPRALAQIFENLSRLTGLSIA